MPPLPGDPRRSSGSPDDVTLPPSAAGHSADGATAPLAPEVPRELINHPRYRVLKLLGQGGMGAVYLAEHSVMGRRVALKTIGTQYLSNREAVARFEREVRAAAKLVHPNIVTAFDAEQAGDLHFLVMEYVEGMSVADYARREGPLPVHVACSIVSQAAVGLQHAHEEGLIHRDVKPANLMLTRKGQVKVLDFGLAQFARREEVRGDAAQTATGAVLGTADYIAPEQTSSSRKVDIRADVYSLGCTLYYLLAGRVPFPEGTVIDKFIHHATDTPTPLASLRAGLPAALVGVVEKMMAKKPEDRYQTPADVVRALRPFLVRNPPAAPPDDKTRPLVEKKKVPAATKRRPRSVLVVTAALLLAPALLLLGWFVVYRAMGGGAAPSTSAARPAARATAKPVEEKAPAWSVAWSGEGPTHTLVAPEHQIPASFLDFKEIEGASVKEFRDWLAGLEPDGFRAAYLSNRAGVGPPLFNGVAVRDRVPVTVRVFVDLSEDEAEKTKDKIKEENLALHNNLHAAYSQAGKYRHSQLWAPGWGYYWLGTRDFIEGKAKEERGDERPAALDWASAGDGQTFTVIGCADDKGQWEAFYQLTRDELLARAEEQRRKGWRPDVIAPYFDGERYRFLAVFRANPEPVDWHLRMDMTLQDYKKATADEKARGRFPLQVVSYGDEAAVKYAALWVRYRIVD